MISGAVLVGGASRRMGSDKARALLRGRTLLARAVDTLAVVVDQVLVVGRADQEIGAPPSTTVVRDTVPGAGPLAGLDAALRASPSDLLVLVAVDMPFLRREVLQLLIESARAQPRADAVVLLSDHGPEPLPAVYRASAARAVGDRLDARRFALVELLDDLEVVFIPPERWHAIDPDGLSVTNVNTPDDLRRLQDEQQRPRVR